jgi:hypothetical protein
MTVTERLIDPPAHWPDTDALRAAASEDSFVLLPDDLRRVDGKLTAFFRTDAQALRVRAAAAGLRPVLLKPDDAQVAGYSEYAADWVLPVIVAAALTVPMNVLADVIHDEISNKPNTTATIVRYREVVLDGDRAQLREIEGPAADIERLLRERGGTAKYPSAELKRHQPLPPQDDHKHREPTPAAQTKPPSDEVAGSDSEH